jgi:uncharacterized protein (DUF2147 family)
MRLRPLLFLRRAVTLAAVVGSLAGPQALARAAVPEGVWLLDGKVAVQIFDCDGLMCGRTVWLATPRDRQDRPQADKNNPDPELRGRLLCGQTILWGLYPDGPNQWRRGRFYNPRDGKTYRVDARLASDDVMLARISTGWLGENKTLTRVPHGTSEGWCP